MFVIWGRKRGLHGGGVVQTIPEAEWKSTTSNGPFRFDLQAHKLFATMRSLLKKKIYIHSVRQSDPFFLTFKILLFLENYLFEYDAVDHH